MRAPKQVELFAVSKNGFTMTVSVSLGAQGLKLASHAFDTDGYERELDVIVATEHVPAVATALGLVDPTKRQLLKALQRRFDTQRADDDFAGFLQEADIPSETAGYSRFP